MTASNKSSCTMVSIRSRAPGHLRFWGESGHCSLTEPRQLMTQSRHWQRTAAMVFDAGFRHYQIPRLTR
jgi:hypothetical protein